MEQFAPEIKTANFPKKKLEKFIYEVCAWGGYAGIATRILEHNSINELKHHFRCTMCKLNNLLVKEALQEINCINGLGTPSFASKHLRFLRPDICPILDSIISQRLKYPFNPSGYQQLYDDCRQIQKILQNNQIDNPMNRTNGQWFVADVEMALFASVNNL